MRRLWAILWMDVDEFDARYPEASQAIAALMAVCVLAGIAAGFLVLGAW